MMDKMEKDDALASARWAAQVAEQLLEKAGDGTKLVSVSYHYPRGRKAFEYGFVAALGAVTAIFVVGGAIVLLSKILSATL